MPQKSCTSCHLSCRNRLDRWRQLPPLAYKPLVKGIYSVAFFDPKGDQEIFTKIVDVAKQCGRLGELMLSTPIYPEYSAVIDPMAYYFMVDELVGHVVSGIKGGKEPFFRNIAKDITLAAILSIRLIAEAEKKKPLLNFNELRKGKIEQNKAARFLVEAERIKEELNQLNAEMCRELGREYKPPNGFVNPLKKEKQEQNPTELSL